MEELCVALEAEFRAPRPAAPRGRGPVAVPDLPRHAVLQGQVAVQDPRRGELRLGRRRRRRGQGRSHTDNVHASGGYFHLQPGEIYVGGGVWHPDTAWLAGFRERVAGDSTASATIAEAPAFTKAFGTGRRRRRVAEARPGRLSRRTTRRRTSSA